MTKQEQSLLPGPTDSEESEVVHCKPEEYESEYHTLVSDQLDNEQIYFECVLRHIREEHDDMNKL